MGLSKEGSTKRKKLKKKEQELAYEEFLSCMFIHCLDKGRYAQLKKDQHNSYIVGKSIYTDTLVDTKKLLKGWKGAGKKLGSPQLKQQPTNDTGVGFIKTRTALKDKRAGTNVLPRVQ